MKIASKENISFTEGSLYEILTENEIDNIPKFLEKITELEMIQKDSYSNEYTFKDRIFYTYYRIKSFEKEYY